jgi:5-methylcytosine-specific restriction endonuclease McrA
LYKALVDRLSIDELTEYTKQCNSFNELILKIGYGTRNGHNHKTVKDRLDKYGISYSHFNNQKRLERNAENVFIENLTATQKVLRFWYKGGNYSEYVCSICGMPPIWNGKELTLILDHINGVNNDDRLENLRWVCPNCNQQLPTTGFRGRKYT